VLLVLIRELHVRDVRAEDADAVAFELAIEVVLHVPHVAAAQIVGPLGADLPAPLPDRILHRAGENEVEVGGPDGADKVYGFLDAELEKEFDGLERYVLLCWADSYRSQIGDLGRCIHHVLDLLPRPPEVVATG
jgi:hypothetical protein